jgi:hypothetical protein
LVHSPLIEEKVGAFSEENDRSSENFHSNQNYDLSDKNFTYSLPKGDNVGFYQSEKNIFER